MDNRNTGTVCTVGLYKKTKVGVVTFDVLTDMIIKSTTIWNVVACSLVQVYIHLHLQGRTVPWASKQKMKCLILLAASLLGLLFDPEDGGSTCHRHVGKLLPGYTASCENYTLLYWSHVRFEVSMAAKIYIVAFWGATPCTLVSGYNITEEHSTSIFRIYVALCHNREDYNIMSEFIYSTFQMHCLHSSTDITQGKGSGWEPGEISKYSDGWWPGRPEFDFR
jgi:hypothetical protein